MAPAGCSLVRFVSLALAAWLCCCDTSAAAPMRINSPGGIFIILDGRTYYMAPGELDVQLGLYWPQSATGMTSCHRSNSQAQVWSPVSLLYDLNGSAVYLDDALTKWPLNFEFGVWTFQVESKTHDIVCSGEVASLTTRIFANGFE